MTVYTHFLLRENTDGTGTDVVISPPQLDPGTCGPDRPSPLDGMVLGCPTNAAEGGM